MAAEKGEEKITRKKIPEFRIRKSQINDMKSSARILELLSEKPEVLKKIANEFSKITAVKEEDALMANYEAKQNIIDILVSNLKEIPEEVIEKNINILWYHIPYIWYQTWYPYVWEVWGPIVIYQKGIDNMERKYRW